MSSVLTSSIIEALVKDRHLPLQGCRSHRESRCRHSFNSGARTGRSGCPKMAAAQSGQFCNCDGSVDMLGRWNVNNFQKANFFFKLQMLRGQGWLRVFLLNNCRCFHTFVFIPRKYPISNHFKLAASGFAGNQQFVAAKIILNNKSLINFSCIQF